jgi:glutamate N-acetyltransferase/amino-acid N-acetyltransferase
MTAAPVIVSRNHLHSSGGQATAVILNSGNANAATGEQGEQDAQVTAEAVAASLGCGANHVLVCSTGLIGIPLDVDRITGAVPVLCADLGADAEHAAAAAEAIRTTDSVRKEAVVTAESTGGFTVGGMAKGAGMLAPDLATMLSVVTTDAELTPAEAHDVLVASVAESFNALTIDGCTSTNDTVILLASGRAGRHDVADVTRATSEVCARLALSLVEDAEGATKVVRVRICGAHDDADAAIAARKVADSLLVKTSWAGSQPYWGRMASELGSAGIAFDQRLLSISYDGIAVCAGGVAVDHDEAVVAVHLAGRHLEIEADLGIGAGSAVMLTNDLTHGYVDENMGLS